jgi:hypothetical protein
MHGPVARLGSMLCFGRPRIVTACSFSVCSVLLVPCMFHHRFVSVCFWSTARKKNARKKSMFLEYKYKSSVGSTNCRELQLFLHANETNEDRGVDYVCMMASHHMYILIIGKTQALVQKFAVRCSSCTSRLKAHCSREQQTSVDWTYPMQGRFQGWARGVITRGAGREEAHESKQLAYHHQSIAVVTCYC